MPPQKPAGPQLVSTSTLPVGVEAPKMEKAADASAAALFAASGASKIEA